MNTKNKIEHCLRSAPKSPAPDGLLDKLQADISAHDIQTHRSILHRWLAPAGGPISPWRAAAMAVIAIAVLLPLTYGASRLVKVYAFSFESRRVNEDGSVTVTRTGVKLAGDFADEEEARRIWEETRELKRTGKYERTLLEESKENGVKYRIYRYVYTLSDGREIGFGESEQVNEE
jgi:hypothetical protein